MLTLQRKYGEKILIGDDIVIKVVYLDHGKVRLGITAPKEMRIDREELRERIEKEGRKGGREVSNFIKAAGLMFSFAFAAVILAALCAATYLDYVRATQPACKCQAKP